jgi:hypothetical protein
LLEEATPLGREPTKTTLAIGDYDLPDHALSRSHARALFLREIERLERYGSLICDSLPESGCDDAVLAAWATRHRINESWILEAARDTQRGRAWTEGRSFARKWCLISCEVWLDPFDDDDPANPIDTTRAAYLRSAPMRGRGERYWEDRARRANDLGFVPAKRALPPFHYTWTARYQVADASFSDLYRETGSTPSTIEGAVKSLAAFIGLQLRRARRGGARYHVGSQK